MKKVLIITSSPRINSNSSAIAEAFGEGAKAAGHDVKTISLRDQRIEFCRGCLACHRTGKCVITDDANKITEQMLHADVIAFATPVYYFNVSGQLKTMFDRSNPLYVADYDFRDIYVFATAADTEDFTFDGTIQSVRGWIDCFKEAKLAGSVCAGGVTDAGAMEGNEALTEAYEMGLRV